MTNLKFGCDNGRVCDVFQRQAQTNLNVWQQFHMKSFSLKEKRGCSSTTVQLVGGTRDNSVLLNLLVIISIILISICADKANLNKFTFSAFLQFPESLQIKPVGVTNKAQRERNSMWLLLHMTKRFTMKALWRHNNHIFLNSYMTVVSERDVWDELWILVGPCLFHLFTNFSCSSSSPSFCDTFVHLVSFYFINALFGSLCSNIVATQQWLQFAFVSSSSAWCESLWIYLVKR